MSSISLFIEYLKQSDSDAENYNTAPKVSSPSRRITDHQVHEQHFSGATRNVDHLFPQMSDSELSSLVDEPTKKKARGKSKANPIIPLYHTPFLPYVKFQNSEAGRPPVKSKRSKQTSHAFSKDEETIKRLKVPILGFMGLVHASYSRNFCSPSSLHAA